MSIDLLLVVFGVAVGLGYFTVRSRRKQQNLKAQARRAK